MIWEYYSCHDAAWWPWHSGWAEREAATCGSGHGFRLRVIIKTANSTSLFLTHTQSRRTDRGLTNGKYLHWWNNLTERGSQSPRASATGCTAPQLYLGHLRTICTGSTGPSFTINVIMQLKDFSGLGLKFCICEEVKLSVSVWGSAIWIKIFWVWLQC